MPDLVIADIGEVLGADADTYDLLTLAEGKLAVNHPNETGANFEAELALAITGVSRRIVALYGNVVERTYTDEPHTADRNKIVLRHAPRSATATTTVSAVKEYDSSGALTTLSVEDFDTKPADAWILEPEEGAIYRRAGGADASFAAGRRNILVTYTAGRAADTASVPDEFKSAAKVALNHVWHNLGARVGAARTAEGEQGGLIFPAGFALPKAAADFLVAERHPSVG